MKRMIGLILFAFLGGIVLCTIISASVTGGIKSGYMNGAAYIPVKQRNAAAASYAQQRAMTDNMLNQQQMNQEQMQQFMEQNQLNQQQMQQFMEQQMQNQQNQMDQQQMQQFMEQNQLNQQMQNDMFMQNSLNSVTPFEMGGMDLQQGNSFNLDNLGGNGLGGGLDFGNVGGGLDFGNVGGGLDFGSGFNNMGGFGF